MRPHGRWMVPPAAGVRETDAMQPFTDRWPNRCAICAAASRGRRLRVCADCSARFAAPQRRCLGCALALPAPAGARCGRCLRDPPPWVTAVAALDYGYPWDRLLAALKFHDGLDLLPWATGALAGAVTAAGASVADIVLPVPLATARLRERGYNQAWELARGVAVARALPARADWLERLIDTPHQLTLPLEERVANMRGAFAVTAAGRTGLANKRVALVDDVLTTGATLAEASRTLLAAGAAQVEVWVLARTP